jgi:hypothetical protein
MSINDIDMCTTRPRGIPEAPTGRASGGGLRAGGLIEPRSLHERSRDYILKAQRTDEKSDRSI